MKINFVSILALASLLSLPILGMEPAEGQRAEERQLSPMEALPAEIKYQLIGHVIEEENGLQNTMQALGKLRLLNHEFRDLVSKEARTIRLLANKLNTPEIILANMRMLHKMMPKLSKSSINLWRNNIKNNIRKECPDWHANHKQSRYYPKTFLQNPVTQDFIVLGKEGNTRRPNASFILKLKKNGQKYSIDPTFGFDRDTIKGGFFCRGGILLTGTPVNSIHFYHDTPDTDNQHFIVSGPGKIFDFNGNYIGER